MTGPWRWVRSLWMALVLALAFSTMLRALVAEDLRHLEAPDPVAEGLVRVGISGGVAHDAGGVRELLAGPAPGRPRGVPPPAPGSTPRARLPRPQNRPQSRPAQRLAQ